MRDRIWLLLFVSRALSNVDRDLNNAKCMQFLMSYTCQIYCVVGKYKQVKCKQTSLQRKIQLKSR